MPRAGWVASLLAARRMRDQADVPTIRRAPDLEGGRVGFYPRRSATTRTPLAEEMPAFVEREDDC